MTDEEKLKKAQDAFNEKIYSIQTWDDFLIALSSLTKKQVKNFIIINLQRIKQNKTNGAAKNIEEANDIGELITEVDET